MWERNKSCLVLVTVLLAACGGPDASVRPAGDRRAAGSTEALGSWTEIPRAPVGWYRPEGAFWINGRLVVVAGSVIESWDPDTNRWQTIASIPQAEECEGCGYSETAVWTGRDLLLWGGGFSYRAPDGSAHEGVSVDLNGSIVPLPPAPIESRWWHTAVWTGQEMIVWGGACGKHECQDGAAYNPHSNSWRALPEAPMPGYAHSVIWTGDEMIVWGGSDDYESEGNYGFPKTFLNTGAAYDPHIDTWRMIESTPVEPRGWHTAVWTGDEMIVWGGVTSPCTTAPCDTNAADAGAYDPLTGEWREIPHGPLSGRVDHTAVWTGHHMIVWGGSAPGGGVGYDDGAVYELGPDRWSELVQAPISGRYRHSALWTGEGMVIWGGQGSSGRAFADGVVFDPEP